MGKVLARNMLIKTKSLFSTNENLKKQKNSKTAVWSLNKIYWKENKFDYIGIKD